MTYLLRQKLHGALTVEQCLDVLAESSEALGYDLVGFRQTVSEPFFQQFANPEKWGIRLGWPDIFLVSAKKEKTNHFFFAQANRPTLDKSTVLWACDASGFRVDGQGIYPALEIKKIRRSGLYSGITVLIPRPHQQTASVLWATRTKTLQVNLRDLHNVMKLAHCFLQAMDRVHGWRALSPLTSRELICLDLASRGYSDKEIAAKVGRSLDTIRFHLNNSKSKLLARNRTHAIVKAVVQNLIMAS